MKPPPQVSVLMCVYNGSRYLREAVESILGQTFADFEFIVVDDGSTDDSYDILLGYRDPRVRLIRKEHTGLTHSLNVGLAGAKGIWIARMDADDIAEPHRLACQLHRATSDPHLVLVGSNCTTMNAEGIALFQGRYPEEHDAVLRHLEQGGSPFPHTSALFRLQAARECGGYNERFRRSQDIDLWFRLSERGRVVCIQESLVRLRKHSNAITLDASSKMSIVYGVAATLCHLRRQQGIIDPSRGPEDQWKELLVQVEETLTSTGIIAAMRARNVLLEVMRRTNHRSFSIMEIGRVLLKHPRLAVGLIAPHLYRWALRHML